MVLQLLALEPLLIRAIFNGDENDVREILESDSESVSYVDSDKRSPLHAAAFRGDAAIVETLITVGGARVNYKDNKWLTPLHRACAAKVGTGLVHQSKHLYFHCRPVQWWRPWSVTEPTSMPETRTGRLPSI